MRILQHLDEGCSLRNMNVPATYAKEIFVEPVSEVSLLLIILLNWSTIKLRLLLIYTFWFQWSHLEFIWIAELINETLHVLRVF